MKSPFEPRQTEVLRALQAVWAGRPVVVIGAAAIGCSIDMTWRRTQDLDLALVAPATDAAEDLRARGFAQHPKLEHRWSAPGGVLLDVLPVTQQELLEGKLVWPQSGHEMSLVGMDLALEHRFDVPLGRGQSIAVASLGAIVVLKIAAWLDRPSERQRDLSDLGYIMSDYLAADDMRRWDDARLSDVEHADQGALALGLDLAAIIRTPHRHLVQEFLSAMEPESAAFDRLSRSGSSVGRDPHATLKARLELLQQGLSRSRSRR